MHNKHSPNAFPLQMQEALLIQLSSLSVGNLTN